MVTVKLLFRCNSYTAGYVLEYLSKQKRNIAEALNRKVREKKRKEKKKTSHYFDLSRYFDISRYYDINISLST